MITKVISLRRMKADLSSANSCLFPTNIEVMQHSRSMYLKLTADICIGLNFSDIGTPYDLPEAVKSDDL